MTVDVAILAAGTGQRFGTDKTLVLVGGRPVWRWSYDWFSHYGAFGRVFVVAGEHNRAAIEASGVPTILGGSTRGQSAQNALAVTRADAILFHDAARPFLVQDAVERVLTALARTGGAAAALPVTDTIKRVFPSGGVETLDRTELRAMQTPQAARTDWLRDAYARATQEHTDDLALLESAGYPFELVAGDPQTFKITTPDDLLRARAMVGGPQTRTGLGYDIHPFDPTRELWLGGVHFPEGPGLAGHSDADVLLHAVTDAILGAAALGDIGQHFPNTDPQWRGASSLRFLAHAAALARAAGWEIVNLDLTAVAEIPKIMRRADEIRHAIAAEVDIPASAVNVKATTNERLGSIGRAEGIAAFAVATLREQTIPF